MFSRGDRVIYLSLRSLYVINMHAWVTYSRTRADTQIREDNIDNIVMNRNKKDRWSVVLEKAEIVRYYI